jgi:hypothetical protein
VKRLPPSERLPWQSTTYGSDAISRFWWPLL